MAPPHLRTPTPFDGEAIKALAVATEMFGPDEVGFFDDLLAGYFEGSLADTHWVVATTEVDEVIGAAYWSVEPFADRLWNLYFIAVHPNYQGGGLGHTLIDHVESDLVAKGEHVARIVLIETSATAQYDGTRKFYVSCGYVEEARIREFYGPNDDKVTFWKRLGTATA